MDDASKTRWEQFHLEEGMSWYDQYRYEQQENAQLRNKVEKLEHLCGDFLTCYERGKCAYCEHYHVGYDQDWCGLRLHERMEELGVGR